MRRAVALLALVLSVALALVVPMPTTAGTLPIDGAWRAVDPPAPTHRYGAMAAYDPQLHATVLFGGDTLGGPAYADTWLWNGATWRRVTTAHTPPGRSLAAFAYSPALGRIMMFGGLDPRQRPQDSSSTICGFFADTWTFDGRDWTPVAIGEDPTTCTANRAVPQPTSRYGAVMAYDAASGALVLVGGYGCDRFPAEAGTCDYRADTWTFDRRGWRLAPNRGATPPARAFAAMATDERGRPVLFGGGYGVGSGLRNDTWIWQRDHWMAEHPRASPPARAEAGGASWPGRGVVVFGGRGGCQGVCGFRADTWLWRRGTWQQLQTLPAGQGLSQPAAAPDARDRIVVVGGRVSVDMAGSRTYESRDLRVLGPRGWTVVPVAWPEPSAPLGFWWDPRRHADVLLDAPYAITAPEATPRTWLLRNGTWTLDTAAGAPRPARQATLAGFDPVRGEAVLYGGQNVAANGFAGWFADTWVLRDGRWRRVMTKHEPPPGTATIAYDRALHALVMQLTPRENVTVNIDSPAPYNASQLWRWTGDDWLPLDTILGPSDPREYAVVADVPARGTLVVHGGYRGLEPRPDADTIELHAAGMQAAMWTPVVGVPGPGTTGAAWGLTVDGALLVYGGCRQDVASAVVGVQGGAATAGAGPEALSANGICPTETWSLDANGWHRLAIGGDTPPPLVGAVMALTGSGTLAMFGGRTGLGASEQLFVWAAARRHGG